MTECQNCGNPLPDLATFCNQCWQTVDAEDGAATAPGAPGGPGDATRVTTPTGVRDGGGDDVPTPSPERGGSAPRFEAPPPLPGATSLGAAPGAGYPAAPPPPPPPPPTWGPPGASPGGGWSAPGSGPPPSPPSWGQPAGAYGPGYAAPPYRPPTTSTNGMAIASLVCSIAGLLTCGIGSLLGVIFGHIGLSQIKQGGGTQPGRGLAVAGLVIGYLMIALGVVLIIIGVAADSSS